MVMIKLVTKKMMMKVIMVKDVEEDEKKSNIMIMRLMTPVTPIMMRLIMTVMMTMIMKAVILAKLAIVFI